MNFLLSLVVVVGVVGAQTMPSHLETLGEPAAVRTCWLELRDTDADKDVKRNCIRENMSFSFIFRAMSSMLTGNTDSFINDAKHELQNTEEGKAAVKCIARANGLLNPDGSFNPDALITRSLNRVRDTELFPFVQNAVTKCPTPKEENTIDYMECIVRECATQVTQG